MVCMCVRVCVHFLVTINIDNCLLAFLVVYFLFICNLFIYIVCLILDSAL